MNLFNVIVNLYCKLFMSNVEYARYLGVKIGKNCQISTRNWPTEAYLITIKDNVQVTKNVYFHTHGGAHVGRFKYPEFDIFGKIIIEEDAYIGTNSQIMPGVTIGKGALVAAGAVVSKSIPPYEVWGGIPAKKICSVNEYIKNNLKFNLNTKSLSSKEKKMYLLSLDDSKFLKK